MGVLASEAAYSWASTNRKESDMEGAGASCRAAGADAGRERASPESSRVGGRSSMVMSRWSV